MDMSTIAVPDVYLVTGDHGFIGSHFLRALLQRKPDALVVGLDALYEAAQSETLKHPNYVFVHGKTQDERLVRALLQEHGIRYVIHFAAQSHVDTSFTTPLQYTEDNVQGTHVLLECCRQYGQIERFLHVSTDEVFGECKENEQQAKTETSLLLPTNPYAASKAAAEMYCQAYRHSFNMPIIITRSNNVYGPGQYEEKLIPRFFALLRRGQRCTIHGDGSQRRSFLYIDDLLNALHIVFERGAVGECYNIASTEEYSVLEVARKLIPLVRGHRTSTEQVAWLRFVPDRCFNDRRYWVCDQKLRRLGWSPSIGFDEGLRRIYASLQLADTSERGGMGDTD